MALLIFNLFAKYFTVTYKDFKYAVDYNENKFEFVSSSQAAVFDIKDCNLEMIQALIDQIESHQKLLHLTILAPQFTNDFLSIYNIRDNDDTTYGDTFYERPSTKTGNFFLRMPKLIEDMEIRDQLLCKKI